ncbi:uncharacterized protein LOC126734473 [Anthonomus grandis grandis]|uniref:uncharacterized protein LOC126734473 n=1 Tax=Anthonomus grandis grandis TaxID=2921223 RepID=UPI00216633EC|nr:uncharacterized protein LOC126734473 [Anthonomus grandis grandis]
MNVPKYSMDNKVKRDFLEFLKAAHTFKNEQFCDVEEYNLLKTVVNLDKETKEQLALFSNQTDICIDITQSDDEQQKIKITDDNHEETNLENSYKKPKDASVDIDITLHNGLVEEIKDWISGEEIVTQSILKEILALNTMSLDKLFKDLSNILTSEEIKKFWTSLSSNDSNNELILAKFLQFIFIPNSKLAYRYEFEEVFLAICEKDGKLLRSELIQELTKEYCSDNQTIIQYLIIFDNGYKTDILRDFVNSIDKLQADYIPIIETLLNPKVDQHVFCQLIEVMAFYAMDFCTDNSYGKLLYKLVNLMDKNLTSLEQPLKRILGTHKSIWKMKIEKTIVSWFNETLTQSFM